MRYFILILSALICSQAYAQFGCYQHSRLYIFDKNSQPRHFTERLGNHPEFPFLQEINGVSTPALFIKAIRDPEKQRRYAREFKAFDLLLRNSGFKHGYKDLSEKNVEDIFVAYGTIGNLGFYDKKKDLINYLYVRLNPAGEPAEGVAAWRLTNAAGCYLYILHTCGNAFYPYNPGDCCKAVSVESHIQFLKQPDSAERSLQLTLNLYQASINASKKKKNGYDTVVKLIRHKDTVVHIKDKNSTPWKIYANDSLDKILICKDTVLKLYTQLLPDSSALAAANGKLKYVLSDTVYLKKEEPKKEEEEPVENKWEVSLDAGKSWNSIPRFNNATQHTQTNGSQLTAELAISRILNHWLQVGVSASYIRLSYQDDSLYAGSVAGTYNTVWLGKRIIPVQLFAKATIGKPVGWQANVSISAGYAIPGDDKIENSGTTLTTRPNFKGGFTAGFRLGLAYFFTSHFGLGVSFTGQYFENKNNDEALMSYKPMALPIMGGVRVRF